MCAWTKITLDFFAVCVYLRQKSASGFGVASAGQPAHKKRAAGLGGQICHLE